MTTSAQDKLPLPVELPTVAPEQDSTPCLLYTSDAADDLYTV